MDLYVTFDYSVTSLKETTFLFKLKFQALKKASKKKSVASLLKFLKEYLLGFCKNKF